MLFAIIYLCFADLTFIFTPMFNVDVISVVSDDEGRKGKGKRAAKKGKGPAKHILDDDNLDDDDCTCFFSEHVFFVACLFRLPFSFLFFFFCVSFVSHSLMSSVEFPSQCVFYVVTMFR